MVRTASEQTRTLANVSVRQGDAQHTGLPAASADVVFARALLHHLGSVSREASLREANRLLVAGGLYLAQDRTPEGVAQPGGPEHPPRRGRPETLLGRRRRAPVREGWVPRAHVLMPGMGTGKRAAPGEPRLRPP